VSTAPAQQTATLFASIAPSLALGASRTSMRPTWALMWASPTLDMRLEHFAASAFAPAIPSVILSITQEA
jgi:hypothetical protein